MAEWKSIQDELPPDDLPVLLWGNKLEAGLDQPLAGRLCGCHGWWLIEDFHVGYETEADRAADEEFVVERMLGHVTHWLDWRPGPSVVTEDEPGRNIGPRVRTQGPVGGTTSPGGMANEPGSSGMKGGG